MKFGRVVFETNIVTDADRNTWHSLLRQCQFTKQLMEYLKK